MDVRRATERLTRRLVFRRRMPSAFCNAPIYVSPAAGLKHLFKGMDALDPPLLRSAMLIRPGDVIWDIGANVGIFSVAAAVRAGREGQVFAFEPDTWLVDLLRRTSAAQKPDCAKMTIVPAAIGNGISLRSFQIAKRSRASNALAGYGQSQMGGVEEEQIVPTFNLDWLLDCLPQPQVLKIDVEGAELEVLAGQTRMLREVRPTILCEVASAAAREVTTLLSTAGYVLYDGEKSPDCAVPSSEACWFTIALPEERKGNLPMRSVQGGYGEQPNFARAELGEALTREKTCQ